MSSSVRPQNSNSCKWKTPFTYAVSNVFVFDAFILIEDQPTVTQHLSAITQYEG